MVPLFLARLRGCQAHALLHPSFVRYDVVGFIRTEISSGRKRWCAERWQLGRKPWFVYIQL